MPTAVVTGASEGLGRALAQALAERGWSLVIDGRREKPLADVTERLIGAGAAAVRPVAGDIADPGHRAVLATVAEDLGGADVVVNNASTLGASPQPHLADWEPSYFAGVYAVNVFAPLALIRMLLPGLRTRRGRVVNLSSDAAVEPYEGWGAYGSSKAALDHASAILAVEEPELRVYAVDPGDMRTRMHQDAFPGEDISDRAEPESVVPALLHLVEGDLPSGRYQASELTPVVA
ncbi:MAG TPA: SDR family oxidoreductase [Nocardioidaceae bacterium]|nr:SDR family oxidoreductase [Nocardioidaceae bacterium]